MSATTVSTNRRQPPAPNIAWPPIEADADDLCRACVDDRQLYDDELIRVDVTHLRSVPFQFTTAAVRPHDPQESDRFHCQLVGIYRVPGQLEATYKRQYVAAYSATCVEKYPRFDDGPPNARKVVPSLHVCTHCDIRFEWDGHHPFVCGFCLDETD